MNNQKISARQVKRTLTLELLGISTLLLPSLVATDSGVDGFFCTDSRRWRCMAAAEILAEAFQTAGFFTAIRTDVRLCTRMYTGDLWYGISGTGGLCVLRHGCSDGTAAIGKWLGANDSADAGGSGIFRTGARTGKPGESI